MFSRIGCSVCTSVYTKTVRPSTIFTNGTKKRFMRELAIDFDANKDHFELDHIIPLAWDGHPRNPHNLRLQVWKGQKGAKCKDRLKPSYSASYAVVAYRWMWPRMQSGQPGRSLMRYTAADLPPPAWTLIWRLW